MGLLSLPIAGLDAITDTLKNPFSQKVKPTVFSPDYPEGFFFEELQGPKESVRLLGNMMPVVPFVYGGTQRVSKDYYPGYSEPVVQVLGSEETDLTIHGRLYDKRYKNPSGAKEGGFYGVAYELAKQIDAIRIRGNLLKLSLGEWNRYGFLIGSKFDEKNRADLKYELKFLIVGFSAPTNSKFLDSKTLPTTINKKLISEALAFQKTSSRIPASMPQDIAGLLNGYINDLAEVLHSATSLVDTVIGTGESVLGSVNRAIGMVKFARASVSVFSRRVGAIKFSASNSVPVSVKYATAGHLLKTINLTASLSVTLANLQSQLAKLKQSVPKARHLVKQGDTLQGLAMKYFSNADEWKSIYDHNKLTSTQLVNGKVLEIPNL